MIKLNNANPRWNGTLNKIGNDTGILDYHGCSEFAGDLHELGLGGRVQLDRLYIFAKGSPIF